MFSIYVDCSLVPAIWPQLKLYGKAQGIPAIQCCYLWHGVWRARHSDRSENSFVMVVYEKNFFSLDLDRKFWLKFKKKFLIDSHYKTIFRSVRMACSSYTVYEQGCSNYAKSNMYINPWQTLPEVYIRYIRRVSHPTSGPFLFHF